MRRNGLVAFATAALVLAGAVAAHAQSWRADIGVNGGAALYTKSLGNDAWGGNGDPVKFKPGWLAGAQLGFWFTPRIGVRANGTYTDAKLREGTDNSMYDDVNLWSATGDLLLRLRQPSATPIGMEMLPYVALGAGVKFVNPAANNYTIGSGQSGIPFACYSTPQLGIYCGGLGAPLPAAGANGFFLAQAKSVMGLIGLGSDFRLAPNFALRAEIGDRMWKPKIYSMGATYHYPFPATTTLAAGDNVAKLTHELYAQVGLHLLLGLAPAPVVAVTPTPAPPPPPPPPPPPAPTTATTSVCVVDPTAATGLRTETATVTLATNDTTVMVNGTATPLRTAYTTVPTAAGAQWYVSGQPLAIGTGTNALSYVSFGTARNITSDDLAFVGTVNGLPVYANKADVASLTIPSPAVEIGTNPALLTGLRNVQVLYVPVSAYGCNFQPVQLQQAVRKGPARAPGAAHPTLRRGSRGDAVKELQQKLNITPANGIFGPKTAAAVRAFQRSHGIKPVSGIVGPKTWAELDKQ